MTLIWINSGSGNGFLPDGIKPLPEPMLTYHQWIRMIFIWCHFTKDNSANNRLNKYETTYLKFNTNFPEASESINTRIKGNVHHIQYQSHAQRWMLRKPICNFIQKHHVSEYSCNSLGQHSIIVMMILSLFGSNYVLSGHDDICQRRPYAIPPEIRPR